MLTFYDFNDFENNGLNATPINTGQIGDQIHIVITAEDPDLDMTNWFVDQFLDPDYNTPVYSDQVTLPAQAAPIMIYWVIGGVRIDGPAGLWLIETWVTDAEGHTSNILTANFTTTN